MLACFIVCKTAWIFFSRFHLLICTHQEEELKKAADSVLSEVRKKQSDAKKMVDILKALEKLRKLRKEAASRKGKGLNTTQQWIKTGSTYF